MKNYIILLFLFSIFSNLSSQNFEFKNKYTYDLGINDYNSEEVIYMGFLDNETIFALISYYENYQKKYRIDYYNTKKTMTVYDINLDEHLFDDSIYPENGEIQEKNTIKEWLFEYNNESQGEPQLFERNNFYWEWENIDTTKIKKPLPDHSEKKMKKS